MENNHLRSIITNWNHKYFCFRWDKLRCTATPCFALYELFDFAFNIGLSDTAVMDMMVSTLQQQRAVTEQLRREAAIKRIPVSVAVADIVKYINEHEQEDCLLVGFSSQKVNPFREKSSCTVL